MMKKPFEDYLVSVGITDLFLERADRVITFYEGVCSKELNDIFVSEYLDSDGGRHYENLWVFDGPCAMEAKNFLKEDCWDAISINGRVRHWVLSKNSYEFDTAVNASRLSLKFTLPEGVRCELRASGKNCDKLRDVFQAYVLNNLA